MKNAFEGLLNRLDMAKERISELEEMSIEIPKLKSKDKKIKKMEPSKHCKTIIKGVIHM